MMSPVERRTRILIASGLATIFIGYFIYAYPADAASGSWVSLAIDGVLLAIGTFCAFEFIRSTWKLFASHSEHSVAPSRPVKNRESIDFRP
jgi:fluoride ion exporter CrcB/FEX